jgi:hypothetical protein
MAQTTGRDNVRGEADKAGDAAQELAALASDATAQAISTATEAVQAGAGRTLDAARELAEQVEAPMVRLVLDRAAPAMHDMVKAESDLATFWLEMTRDQAQHTIDIMQRLATVRDWREALDLQAGYLRESMARMSAGISRQLSLTGSLAGSMFDAGRGKLKDAA